MTPVDETASAPWSLSGKVAIVTGAGAGIGAAVARVLAERGAQVLVADINAVGAEETAASIASTGGSAMPSFTDVAVEEDVQALIDRSVTAFGGLDILINNAAATSAIDMARDGVVTEQDVTVWDRIMAVNLRGPMLGCKHAIPRMIARGGGAIVNTVSPAAHFAEPTHAAYGASKAGLVLLTKHIASCYGQQGIRCNGVSPGAVIGENTLAAVPADFLRTRARHTCSPRLGRPLDIAETVAFLVSSVAEYINGVVLPVDGAYTAHLPYFADHVASLEGA